MAFRWLEVEGPLHDEWPTAGHRLLFGDLPLKPADQPAGTAVDVVSARSAAGCRASAAQLRAAGVSPAGGPERGDPLPAGHRRRLEVGQHVRRRDDRRLHGGALLARSSSASRRSRGGSTTTRWRRGWRSSSGTPRPTRSSARSPRAASCTGRDVLRAQTERLLDDPKSRRFVDAFLDYWLDLRKIVATAPDAALYPDYYLDDLLSESALEETAALLRRAAAAATCRRGTSSRRISRCSTSGSPRTTACRPWRAWRCGACRCRRTARAAAC